ncbi:MAG: YihY family inner membrane protein [Bdellovibrionaceae bacterium]|nr:YihY family inner membrane protein [Pseudobdellovibrionaceae bacterium]
MATVMTTASKIIKIARDIFRELQVEEVRLIAAALSFITIMSLIPFVVVVLGMVKSIGLLDFLYPKLQSFIVSLFREAIGTEATRVVRQVIERLLKQKLEIGGTLILFATSFKLLTNIQLGINRFWRVQSDEGLGQRLFLGITFMVSFPLILAAYAGLRSIKAMPISPLALDYFVYLFGALLLYKFVPARRTLWRPALLSAFVTSWFLLGLQVSYSWLSNSFFLYSKMYGALAALPLFCAWVWTLWYIVLAGAALQALMQRLIEHGQAAY